MSEIDWKTELRKLEREFDGLPPEPTPEELRAEREALLEAQRQRERQITELGVWARIALVAALAAGLLFWPYGHACGVGLFAYMAAAAMITAGGLWAAVWTWRARMGVPHGIALVLVAWGLVLLAGQLLPRTGYARTDPANPPGWWCSR
ncbi:MAG TPA: hypothetical protein VF192_07650 [Longimicrobiales bacterium]